MLEFSSPQGPWRIWAIFALLAGLVLAVLSQDFWPRPLYDELQGALGGVSCYAGQPITVTLAMPGKPAESVSFYGAIPPVAPLLVSVSDAVSGEEFTRAAFAKSGRIELPLPESADNARALRLRFESTATTPETGARLILAKTAPNWPLKVAPAGFGMPLLFFHFRWPTRNFLWAWGLLPLAGWMTCRRPRTVGLYLLGLGLGCMVTSLLVWQRHYSLYYAHLDADSYGACAQNLADYLTHPEQRETARTFLSGYAHLATMLCSLLMAGPIALGAPVEMTYLMLSALCGFGALVTFARILEKDLRVSMPVLLISTTLFAVHWLHLRSFDRPIPDEFGLLLVVVLLKLLIDRAYAQTAFSTAALASMVLILSLGRPQGLGYLPFLVGGVLACDSWRERQWALSRRFITGLRLTVIPLLLLAALYFNFDWFYNFQVNVKDVARFGGAIPKAMYLPAVIGSLQWLPVIWLCGRRELWKTPPILILAGWGLFYAAMLVAVRAPMMPRHFVPLLPTFAGLMAGALESVRPRLRAVAWSLAVLACAANLAVMVHQICAKTQPTPPASYYVTSP